MLPPQTLNQILTPWRQVTARADQFFERVFAAQRSQMQCGPGCVACCQQDLSLLLVEALAVLAALDRAQDPPRAGSAGSGCALLVDGRCAVYAERPTICRTHGLAIRYSAPEGLSGDLQADPGVASCCELNFVQQPPPAHTVLDGTVLLAGLSVADAMARQALGVQDTPRIPISQLVEHRWDLLGE